MKRPQILFLDIDGTILRSDYSLSDRVIAAMKKMKATSTRIVLATGRSWESLRPFYDALNLDGLTICYNGAVIIGGPDGQILSEVRMAENVARSIINIARKERLELVVFRHSQLLFERVGPKIKEYRMRTGLLGKVVNFDDYEHLEFTKVIAISKKDNLAVIKPLVEEHCGFDRVSATYSNPGFLEFMAGGVDKGYGLRKVCKMHQIDVTETAAIGDAWNDFALLQSAGVGWLMGGAPADLKAHFPSCQIVPSVEADGAAIVMEAMLSGREPVFPLEFTP